MIINYRDCHAGLVEACFRSEITLRQVQSDKQI